MPLVEISALPQPLGVDVRAVLDRVSLATASAMQCDPDAVWVTWRTIEPGHYRVSGQAPDQQPAGSHDPIARITAYHGRSDETIAGALEAVARTLAGSLGIAPGNIFVIYDEIAPGRVFTGGSIRR
jgi:phenylpyruvate tautomerase PptA (4-oxalocrotonate tautomerase family)